MTRPHVFVPREWYHCFNVRKNRERLFLNRSDFMRFQAILYCANSCEPFRLRLPHSNSPNHLFEKTFSKPRGSQIVDIGAYALMPDRYHVLVRERVSGGVSTFMHRLNTSYAMYFNARYDRSGHVFPNRYRSIHIEKDAYLQKVVNYIHGNPIEAFEPGFVRNAFRDARRLIENISRYGFSSLYDYQQPKRPESAILSQKVLEKDIGELPSTEHIFEDFSTFYSKSNYRAWVHK